MRDPPEHQTIPYGYLYLESISGRSSSHAIGIQAPHTATGGRWGWRHVNVVAWGCGLLVFAPSGLAIRDSLVIAVASVVGLVVGPSNKSK